MAANPQIPPKGPEHDRTEGETLSGGRFPWGLVGAIIAVVCLILLGYYFFH